MIWKTIKNPRKENGDLGDYHCTFCKANTGAFVVWDIDTFICGGCLQDGIDAINKEILSGLPHFYRDAK